MNNLKKLRKQKGITQKEFSKSFEVPLRTLQKWENGESNIKPKNAQALADHFGVSVAYLLGYTETPMQFDDEEIIGNEEVGVVNAISLKRTFKQLSEESLKSLVLYLSEHGFYLSNQEIIELWNGLYITSVNHGDDLKTRLFHEVRKDPSHPQYQKLENDYSLVLNYREGDELPFKNKES